MLMNKVTNSTVLENVDLTPTQIATILLEKRGIPTSCRKVNLALETLGLQQKLHTGNRKQQWQLTEKGKKYGRVYQVEASHSNWSGNQIKWSESVLNLLQSSP